MKKRQVTSTRTAYSEKCQRCKKEIKAFSESNLEYNMRLHREKCDGSKKNVVKKTKGELNPSKPIGAEGDASNNSGGKIITKQEVNGDEKE